MRQPPKPFAPETLEAQAYYRDHMRLTNAVTAAIIEYLSHYGRANSHSDDGQRHGVIGKGKAYGYLEILLGTGAITSPAHLEALFDLGKLGVGSGLAMILRFKTQKGSLPDCLWSKFDSAVHEYLARAEKAELEQRLALPNFREAKGMTQLAYMLAESPFHMVLSRLVLVGQVNQGEFSLSTLVKKHIKSTFSEQGWDGLTELENSVYSNSGFQVQFSLKFQYLNQQASEDRSGDQPRALSETFEAYMHLRSACVVGLLQYINKNSEADGLTHGSKGLNRALRALAEFAAIPLPLDETEMNTAADRLLTVFNKWTRTRTKDIRYNNHSMATLMMKGAKELILKVYTNLTSDVAIAACSLEPTVTERRFIRGRTSTLSTDTVDNFMQALRDFARLAFPDAGETLERLPAREVALKPALRGDGHLGDERDFSGSDEFLFDGRGGSDGEGDDDDPTNTY